MVNLSYGEKDTFFENFEKFPRESRPFASPGAPQYGSFFGGDGFAGGSRPTWSNPDKDPTEKALLLVDRL